MIIFKPVHQSPYFQQPILPFPKNSPSHRYTKHVRYHNQESTLREECNSCGTRKRAPGRPTLHPRPGQARLCLSLCFVAAFCAHIMPATAADESHAISQAQDEGYRVPIGLFIPLLVLIGQCVFAYFGALVSPLMGITSLLWLMMRNDAAIDPKASWM